jgi:hypothetical protein
MLAIRRLTDKLEELRVMLAPIGISKIELDGYPRICIRDWNGRELWMTLDEFSNHLEGCKKFLDADLS